MMSGIFNLSKNGKRLVVIMFSISVITVIAAYLYYEQANRLEDPRAIPIARMYERYNKHIYNNDFYKVIAVLDSMEAAYGQIDHYQESYEIGVICTDRAAAYLTMALYNTADQAEKAGYLAIADRNLNRSLDYYEKFELKFKDMDAPALIAAISADFSFLTEKREKIIGKRAGIIETAVQEINRRKSVAYTNLGIVKRHQLDTESAIECYQMALELWPENHSAKSNLNVLLGGEPLRRNFIQKLFPPDKDQ
ncbi:MAG: tetratricopeptide repeat protein [Candidatus Cloacimonetes bacterium]|nr:tetratricopeptide repeat protein [Candidatus Cloacimonadota bacterium]